MPTIRTARNNGEMAIECIHGLTHSYAALTPVNATGARQAALAHRGRGRRKEKAHRA